MNSDTDRNNRSKQPAMLPVTITLLALAVVFFFHQTFAGLLRLWLNDADYSYALAIPFVSVFFIWQDRDRLRSSAIRPNWIGGAFLLMFLIIGLYGTLGSSPSAVRPTIPLLILSLTLFCFGTQWFRILLFPLFLLLFMIPLPTLLQTRFGIMLQILSTQLGAFLLRLSGVTVFVEGNVIDLGVTQLQVVDACSGLRFALPLLALGFVFARFFEKRRWKQAILVGATLPMSILANGVRIGITGYMAQHHGAATAEGFFHVFSGWLFFVFALLLLIGLHLILRHLAPDPTAAVSSAEAAPFSAVGSGSNADVRVPALLAGLALLAAGFLNSLTAALPPVRLSGGLSGFPLSFDQWTGRTETLDPRIVSQSGAELAFNGSYRNGAGEIVSLYIGYRGSPFIENENFFHSPSVCLPSLGWHTAATAEHTITNVPLFGQIIVRKMLIEKMGVRQLVYYWFQTKNKTSANVHINRFHLTWHALSRDNTYDLFIRPITPLLPNEPIGSAENRLDQFVRTMMAELLAYLQQHQAPIPHI